MKKLLTISLLVFLLAHASSCGSERGGAIEGDLAIRVSRDGDYDPNVSHGEIDRYVVQVTAGDMDPIVEEFAGDAAFGVIRGVPTGADRQVKISVINPNSKTILEGEKGDVNIGGGINDVEVLLESVPIIANIGDDATILNTRLRMEIFADPASPVSVTRNDGSAEMSIVDRSTSLSQFYTNESTWLASVSPGSIPEGWQVFTVMDMRNNRSSTVRVRVIDGENAVPAPFAAAAAQGADYVSRVDSIE